MFAYLAFWAAEAAAAPAAAPAATAPANIAPREGPLGVEGGLLGTGSRSGADGLTSPPGAGDGSTAGLG